MQRGIPVPVRTQQRDQVVERRDPRSRSLESGDLRAQDEIEKIEQPAPIGGRDLPKIGARASTLASKYPKSFV